MNNGQVQIVYDGDGNRASKIVGATATKYLVDDLNPTGYAQVIEEVVNGLVQRTYTYGTSRISQNQFINTAWTASFYGHDGMGSVRLLTNPAGVVTDTYDYDAWGNAVNVVDTTPNLYRYIGEQYDSDLGLYYLRARYFNPLSGRFLTLDPEAGRISSPPTLHEYLYANGDPVNFVDPSGRGAIWECVMTFQNITIKVALHPATHYFKIGGQILWCVHIMLVAYEPGGLQYFRDQWPIESMCYPPRQ